MNGKDAVVLDGSRAGEPGLGPILEIVKEELNHGGSRVTSFSLRDASLAHCIGCFGCWLETPGLCREDDDGRAIVKSIARSDLVVLVTPVTFGGYSSELKKGLERLVPLALPHFTKFYGETHHLPRYSAPRLIVLGVQQSPEPEAAHQFRALAARNALNFHTESHAAEVIDGRESPEVARWAIRSLLSRTDPLRFGPKITAFQTQPDSTLPVPAAGSRRALLILGSPKVLSASTSGVLGDYFLDRLVEHGWDVEGLRLKASLRRSDGQAVVLSAVKRADLLVFAFPLYVDSVPYLMTKAMELIADYKRLEQPRKPQTLLAIVNNGFPETYQNAPALAICRRFALETGIAWAGGLPLGAGEALSSGAPLTGAGHAGRLPVNHVIQALDLAAAAVSQGQPVPEKAVELMGRSPIPFLPFAAWRWIYYKGGARNWHRLAADHGVSKEAMLATPYAE